MWIADILACVLVGMTAALVDFSTPSYFALSATAVVAAEYVALWRIRRFGFVALVAAWMPRALISPFVWGSWYTGRLLVTQLIPLAVAASALWVISRRSSGQRANPRRKATRLYPGRPSP